MSPKFLCQQWGMGMQPGWIQGLAAGAGEGMMRQHNFCPNSRVWGCILAGPNAWQEQGRQRGVVRPHPSLSSLLHRL